MHYPVTSDKEEHFLVSGAGDELGVSRKACLRAGDQNRMTDRITYSVGDSDQQNRHLRPDIVTTFLELGDATSCNLEFAQRRDVSVSYGEETITENNLQEIRRRHPHLIYLKTVPKQKESKCVADREWRVIGRRYTASSVL